MESNHFSLEVNKSNRFTRIFQVIFGIICAVLAVIWLIMNIKTLSTNGSLVLTIIFLLGFAYYLVNSGLGKGDKYIEIGRDSLRIKKNSIFPATEIKAGEIQKIEIFPLNIVFILKSGKKVLLRFGTYFTEVIEPVKTGVESFCEANGVPFEAINESL